MKHEATKPGTSPAIRMMGRALADNANRIVAGPKARRTGIHLQGHLSNLMPSRVARPRQPDFLPYIPGKLGGFPFNWENPRNLKFSTRTYEWICSSVEVSDGLVRPVAIFALEYARAMTALEVRRSQADTAALKAAAEATSRQAMAFSLAWRTAYGSLPPGDPVIDVLIDQITGNWATAAVTFSDLLNAADIGTLLDNVPASAVPLLADLALYLDAAKTQIGLLDMGPFDTGRLRAVRDAVNHPSEANGALELDDGTWRPAFTILPSPEDIAAALTATGEGQPALTGSIQPSSGTTPMLQFAGGAPVPLDADALSVRIGGVDVLSTELKGTVPLRVEYDNVVTVHFGPQDFTLVSQGWFWARPLIEGLSNLGQDVTGFVLGAPEAAGILTSGSFGYLTAAAISRAPVIRLRGGMMPGMPDTGTADLTLCGQSYQARFTFDQTNGLVLKPMVPQSPGDPSERAFVHAVQPCFPVAAATTAPRG